MSPNFVTVSRTISTFKVLRASMAEPLKAEAVKSDHLKESWKIWKKIFFFVCIPALGLGAINSIVSEEPPPPEFKPYSYLRIRNVKFPWRDGNKSLFHNPHRNALPDGYEKEPH